MPRPYPPEFRQRALDLARSGRSVAEVAELLGIAQSCLYRWKQRDLIDRGLKPATGRVESAELVAARQNAGLLPSLGTVGDPYDNAVVESFWGRMQVELLNRQRWRTRVDLANAIFEYIEGFHNRRRRHRALAWATPLEFETEHRHQATTPQGAFRETGA